jgi:oxygen-independent coproporphyrinogen-3 oxidase
MTRLRTTLGIPLDKLTANDRQYCLNIANPYIEQKLLSVKNNHLHLTKEGIFISNDIISDLMRS